MAPTYTQGEPTSNLDDFELKERNLSYLSRKNCSETKGRAPSVLPLVFNNRILICNERRLRVVLILQAESHDQKLIVFFPGWPREREDH